VQLPGESKKIVMDFQCRLRSDGASRARSERRVDGRRQREEEEIEERSSPRREVVYHAIAKEGDEELSRSTATRVVRPRRGTVVHAPTAMAR
jgi:hypothetical protein